MAIEFPSNTELYIGFMMCAMTFGITAGPAISAGLYPVMGYTYVFFFFAALILVFGFVPILFVPARINYQRYEKKMAALRRAEAANDEEAEV